MELAVLLKLHLTMRVSPLSFQSRWYFEWQQTPAFSRLYNRNYLWWTKKTFNGIMKQPSQMFFKIGVLKNFALFTPVDTECKLNAHKTFRRRPGCVLNVLCTFNLRPVSRGWSLFRKRFQHRCFSVNIGKFLKTFFREHLRKTASRYLAKNLIW